jgi:DNA-binding MarR family transcriptional regulator
MKTKNAPPAVADPAAAKAFYRSGSYVIHESVGYLMRRSVSQLAQEVERRVEPMGLTNAQWVPLLKLHLGHAGTAAELARSCELDAGAVTRLLDRLETKGLCRRLRSSDDRRVVNLELTEEGHKAAKAIPAVLCEVQNACLTGFTAQEWETLKTLLHRFLDNALSLPSAKDKKP